MDRFVETARRLAKPANTSKITRYLAAGSYSDPVFRGKVLKTFVDQTFRAKPPELGVDRESVIAHCVKAKKHRSVRNAAIVVLLFPLIYLGVLSDLQLFRVSTEFFLEKHALSIAAVWLSISIVLYIDYIFIEHYSIRRISLDEGISDDTTAFQNLVVYSGFNPFIGAGAEINSWSFTVNLKKGRNEFGVTLNPKNFTADQIVVHTVSALTRIDDAIAVGERLYVNGETVRNDRRFLESEYKSPYDSVNPELVLRYRGNSSEDARHYVIAQRLDWDGDIAVSCFYRFCKLPEQLFVEANFFVLSPLRKDFYRIDERGTAILGRDLLSGAVSALIYSPFAAISALFSTLNLLFSPVTRFLSRRAAVKEIKYNQRADYGCTTALRDLASDPERHFRNYFQARDVQMLMKTIQQQLLDATAGFLDDHDVDTSVISERSAAIYNSGVIVSGGSLSAEGMSVGTGAQTRLRKTAKGSEVKNG